MPNCYKIYEKTRNNYGVFSVFLLFLVAFLNNLEKNCKNVTITGVTIRGVTIRGVTIRGVTIRGTVYYFLIVDFF